MKLVPVLTFNGRPEAHIALAKLEAHDIKAVMAADDCGGLHPGGIAGGVQVLVAETDWTTARDVLELPDPEPPRPIPWAPLAFFVVVWGVLLGVFIILGWS